MKKILLLLIFLFSMVVTAQNKYHILNPTQIKLHDWIMPQNDSVGFSFGFFQGKSAFFLTRTIMDSKSASLAYPSNLKFRNGLIEMDIALPGNNDGFVGLAFRIKDAHHYETVYFRPSSSGIINAIQYMPEKKRDFNWWDYEANKYQAKALLPQDNWFHVKISVIENTMKVYLNNASKPSMVYNSLDSSLKSGSVGFWLGNCSLGVYKNLKVTFL